MPNAATDDARSALAAAAVAALREGNARALAGPDAIALSMIAVGGGPVSPAALRNRLRKLGCGPALLQVLDHHVVDALDAGVVRFTSGRLHGRAREIHSRVSRVLAGTGPSPAKAAPLRASAERTPTRSSSLHPAISAPPPFRPATVELAALDPTAVATAFASGTEPWEAVLHVLEAHALAAAEQFDELLSIPTLRGVISHRYQLETVRRVLRAFRGRALLADEVGLGKTIEAIMVLREYQLRGMASRILVLTPPSLVHHWVGELSGKAGVPCACTVGSRARTDPEGFWAQDGLVVASLGTARTARHAALVQAQAWDLVIVDEAHHVKRRTTLGWKLVDGLHTRFLLLLTATPIENDLDEIYSLVTLLRPGHFATAATFRAEFVDSKNPTSPRNRERLRGLLSEIMVRNTRASCGLELPPRFVTTITVDPLAPERALYEQVVAFLHAHAGTPGVRMLANVLLLGAGSSPAAVQATLERSLARGSQGAEVQAALRRLTELAATVVESRKRVALLDLMGKHAEEQVLVFTRYRASVGFVVQALRDAGIEHVVFDGRLSATERAATLDAFAAGTRVLVATDVGSEGQNLQHCHVLVNFDLPWNPMAIEQRIGRLHRMGQTSEVRVYNLAARGTIEDRVLEVLDRRLHLFELVVGEMDMVLGNLADDRDLEDRILAIVTDAPDDAAIDAGFAALEHELRSARTRYDHTKALDEALFGEDFEDMIPDPVAFVARALGRAGALTEPAAVGVEAVLPAALARELALPEEVRLVAAPRTDVADAVACGLGTPLLERLVVEARARVPVARLQLDGPARLGRARALAERWVVRNGVTEVLGAIAGEGLYLEAWVAWSAEADDRFEGLLQLVIEANGGEPHGELRLDELEPRERPAAVPATITAATSRWLARRVPPRLAPRLDPIRESVQRRHQRDHHRITEYFASLVAETASRRRKVDADALAAKVQHLVVERDAKLADLCHRYTLRVAVQLAAARWIVLPRATVGIRLRRRKAARELELHLPAGANELDRVLCQGCEGTTDVPAVCDDALHLLCERCAPSAAGRLRCPACGA